jgi:PAS domain S-box-containing protein
MATPDSFSKPDNGLFATMMRRSLSLPLRTKVRLVIVMVASIALLVAVGAVLALQLNLFRANFDRDLTALAAIMASNSSAALDFEDPKAALETLSALQAKPGILGATIVNNQGKRFAQFGALESPQGLAEFNRGALSSADGRHRLHTEAILRDGKQLGLLHIRADYAVRRNELLRASFGIMASVLAGSIVLILALTSRLQHLITRPIAHLANAALDVARRNDYSVRVEKVVDDELGQLTDAFNKMLEEIERQDTAIQSARHSLEQKVNALAASETRFRGVVENLGEALLLVGLNGENLFINPRFTALLGWREEDLQGHDALKLLMPDQDRYGLLLAHEAPQRTDGAIEVQMAHRSGTRIWTEIHASPMRGPDGELIGTLAAILDITTRRNAAEELEEMNKQLVETSRAAGMAEVATGVLHNVGNVLNSVNVTASLSLQKLRGSKVVNLAKAAEMITSKNGDLANWLTTDPQGQRLPGYLVRISEHLATENKELTHDLQQLAENVEHIKEIVSVQQSYACVSGLVETLAPKQLVEDAMRMNMAKFNRHGIDVICDFAPAPEVAVDKHKVLQILVNLMRNAKHAVEESNSTDRRMIVSISGPDGKFVRIAIRDTGVGIPLENLTRIFQLGFTTKKNGHGFGLHSAANAAREMGGSLTAHSDGPGTGAAFTLSLPIASPLSHV